VQGGRAKYGARGRRGERGRGPKHFAARRTTRRACSDPALPPPHPYRPRPPRPGSSGVSRSGRAERSCVRRTFACSCPSSRHDPPPPSPPVHSHGPSAREGLAAAPRGRHCSKGECEAGRGGRGNRTGAIGRSRAARGPGAGGRGKGAADHGKRVADSIRGGVRLEQGPDSGSNPPGRVEGRWAWQERGREEDLWQRRRALEGSQVRRKFRSRMPKLRCSGTGPRPHRARLRAPHARHVCRVSRAPGV
jgi:hypothetical protein